MQTNRFYIENSSMFNSRKYDIKAMRKILASYIKNPRESYKGGLNNQPKVLTFEFDYSRFPNENDAIHFCCYYLAQNLYNGQFPFIFQKDW